MITSWFRCAQPWQEHYEEHRKVPQHHCSIGPQYLPNLVCCLILLILLILLIFLKFCLNRWPSQIAFEVLKSQTSYSTDHQAYRLRMLFARFPCAIANSQQINSSLIVIANRFRRLRLLQSCKLYGRRTTTAKSTSNWIQTSGMMRRHVADSAVLNKRQVALI